LRALVRCSRALSRCSVVSGVTDRHPRGESRASEMCGLGRHPPDRAWRE
jgi:hypothetical protein